MLWLTVTLVVSGCSTYQTPGAGISVGNLSKADTDIAELMKREPAASFPARLAVVRIQAADYGSDDRQCHGTGRYCALTIRDIETEQDFNGLSQLPMMAGVAAIGQMLLPDKLDSIKDLRVAAANLKADMVLVYSVDTRFSVENTDIGPLALISLGFLPNKEAHVTSTAACALFDVRTGFVYGTAESSATEKQQASMWSTEGAIENARLKTEAAAFKQMLGEFNTLWQGVVDTYTRPDVKPIR
ncbi:MAG: hypothetical protein PHU14_02660 [Methylovulum sp.]|nr:hypothetical protein [Methylovulum sp.]